MVRPASRSNNQCNYNVSSNNNTYNGRVRSSSPPRTFSAPPRMSITGVPIDFRTFRRSAVLDEEAILASIRSTDSHVDNNNNNSNSNNSSININMTTENNGSHHNNNSINNSYGQNSQRLTLGSFHPTTSTPLEGFGIPTISSSSSSKRQSLTTPSEIFNLEFSDSDEFFDEDEEEETDDSSKEVQDDDDEEEGKEGKKKNINHIKNQHPVNNNKNNTNTNTNNMDKEELQVTEQQRLLRKQQQQEQRQQRKSRRRNRNNKNPSSTSILKSNPKRKGYVDGREVEWELQENVTQLPITDRNQRLERRVKNRNISKSPFEVRVRLWMMQFNILSISAAYLVIFVLLNVGFAILWYIQEEKCCDDSEFTFGQVFDFAVQTSTTVGYGGYVPIGYFSNFLVVMITYIQLVISTVYAGLLFLKFVTPTAKIEFSNIMTLHNVNGLPCLVARIGNADGVINSLTDVSVRLTCSYYLRYRDETGHETGFGQTETLHLTSDKRHQLNEVWTIRHVLDETSPLYGLDFRTFPGNAITELRLFVSATQDVTKTQISAQAGYMVEDILVGHRFQDQSSWNPETKVITCDYALMNAIVPHPVWYPTTTTTPLGDPSSTSK